MYTHYIYVFCVWSTEQTATFALYHTNRLVSITQANSVYCGVRTEYLYKAHYISFLKG
jgi:hypothetical protein